MSKRMKQFSKSTQRRGTRQVDPLLDEKSQPLSVPIKGKIRPAVETHYLDIAQAAYTADTTGSVTALNLIAEGNDNVNRLGRKAMMRSVSVKGYVSTPGIAAAREVQQVRVLLVWDNAANGALPAVTDVLTAINTTSFPNANGVARFTILHDQAIPLGAFNTTVTQAYLHETTKNIDITRRINAPTEYFGTAAAITSLQNGSLLLLTMGNSANGTAGNAVFTLGTRVTFTDVL
jgi:hypothetical protein